MNFSNCTIRARILASDWSYKTGAYRYMAEPMHIRQINKHLHILHPMKFTRAHIHTNTYTQHQYRSKCMPEYLRI